MLHTGLRPVEVCNPKRKHIHLFQRSGYLEVEGSKRNKFREVPLNITIREVLKEYMDQELGNSDDYLFKSRKTGGQMTTRALGHVIEKYMDLAGLRPDKDGHMWNARDLRHRFGYVMAEKTPLHRLAQIMGHDSLDTTMIYIRASREDLQKDVEKIAWR
jgi:integrase/recombinase XerC